MSEQVRDYDGNLLLTSDWNEGGGGNGTGELNAIDLGCVGDGTTDDTAAIQAIIDDAIAGSVIYFPAGSYKLSAAITMTKPLGIRGDMPGLGGNGTWFRRSADAEGFIIGPALAADRFNGVSLRDFAITGDVTFTTDALILKHIGGSNLENLLINASGGNGIYFDAVWDTTIVKPFVRNCGKHATGKSHIYIEGAGPAEESNNNLFFFSAQLEHDAYGPLLTIAPQQVGANAGDTTDSITFTSCKFESSGRVSADQSPIKLTSASNVAFQSCFFSIYARTAGAGGGGYCIEATSSKDVVIDALCYNNDDPTGLALLTDTSNVESRVRGFKCGNIVTAGNCRGIVERNADDEAPRDTRLATFLQNAPNSAISCVQIARSFNIIVDDAKAISGKAMRSYASDLDAAISANTVLFTQALGGINTTGVQLFIRARLRDDQVASGDFLIQLTRGTVTITIWNFGLTTEYSTVFVPIPRAFCDAASTLTIRNGSATTIAYIEALGWSYDMALPAPPVDTNGVSGDFWQLRGVTWEAGERLRNSQGYASNGRGVEGWGCLTSGTSNTSPLSGITANTTNASKTITVNSAVGLYVGAYISVAGAVTRSKIVRISSLTVTLADAAGATVSAAAVNYVDPVFVELGWANWRANTATLTYGATTQIDFNGKANQTVTLTGNITFTTALDSYSTGKSVTVIIIGDGSARNLTFPAGWTWIGSAVPTSLAANKTAVLQLYSSGTSDSGILALYSVKDATLNDLTADATPDVTADYLMTWDASAGVHKKILLNKLATLAGGQTIAGTNYFPGSIADQASGYWAIDIIGGKMRFHIGAQGSLAWNVANGVTSTEDVFLSRLSAGILQVGSTSANALGALVAKYLKTTGVTVASLPSASTAGAGARCFVTDSNATLAAGLGNTVAGSGSNNVPVYSDGTNWIIG